MDTILVVNAGSSSLKFQIYGIEGARGLHRLVKGQMDGIGTRPRLRAKGEDNRSGVDQAFSPDDVPDLPAALDQVEAWLRQTQTVGLSCSRPSRRSWRPGIQPADHD